MLQKLVALLLSITVVGLGQIFLGHTNHGLKFCLTFYLGIPLYLLFALNFNFYLFIASLTAALFVMPILWGYNIIDVMRSKAK